MPISRARLSELHYIAHMSNLDSIVRRGILSNRKAAPYATTSIANSDVQEIREAKRVPQGLPLHEYANLYFDARNPMMYVRHSAHLQLCVLHIRTDVLDLPGVIIADGNAASADTVFWPSPKGLEYVNEEMAFAEWWIAADFYEGREKKRVRCAEVLVPDMVPPDLIIGCHVSCEQAQKNLVLVAPQLTANVNPRLFFLA